MQIVTGVTGQVGGVVARALLAAKQDVRAIVRQPAKAAAWRELGCEVAQVDLLDSERLADAFAGADGVFVLLPPNFDPAPGFPESRAVIASVRAALDRARPGRVVCLSTVGAQAAQSNLLSQLGLLEQAMAHLPMPRAFLRAAWFMENAAWDVASAGATGVLPSFLQPLDRAIPTVSSVDVGHAAADLLQESWSGQRIVELAHPVPMSPNRLAKVFTQALGRDVRAQALPRNTWEALFRAQGMRYPFSRMRMLDGFNEGWIAFDGQGSEQRSGTTPLEDVVQRLVEAAGASASTIGQALSA